MRMVSVMRRRGAVVVVLGCSLTALFSGVSEYFRAPGPPVIGTDFIDINRASAAELSLLPGVGPALAQAIVDDRSARGPFATTADIDRVRGVGPAALARISAFISAPAYAPQ